MLKPGDPLFLKDRIQTGAGSSAEIVFVDLSRMKLAANTSLEITEYLYNPAEKTRHGLISLTFGKARFAVQDLQEFRDRRFRVQTRTAVVGSRDTDFVVAFDLQVPGGRVSGEGMLSALCLENSIIVFSLDFPDKLALLTANMISQVYGRNLPTPPRFATAAERAALLAGLEQIGNTHIPPHAPQGTITGGEQSVRVIPKGALSVVENGKPVGEFQSEVPVPLGASLVCSGECLVQGEKFQLLAHDKAEFSLVKNDKEWVLTVKSGTVEFSMREDAKLAFVTPKDKYEVTKAIPANGLVRGRVEVTATGTEFSTASGVLYLASAEGIHVFQPGADANVAYPPDLPEIPAWGFAGGAVAVVSGVVAGTVLTTQSGKPSASSQ